MRKKSIFFKIIIFILFCFNLFAAKEKVYIIGTDVHFPPFEFKDENGVLKGIDIELLENFAKNQNFKYKIKQLKFSELEEALKAGKIDAIFSGMMITEERKNNFDISDKYFVSGITMGVHQDSEIDSYEDLTGKFVAVNKRTRISNIVDQLASEHKFIITNLDDTINIIEDVEANLVHACFDDAVLLQYYIKNGAKIKLVSQRENEIGCGVIVEKGKNKELLDKINTGLKNLKKSGKYHEILKKYLALNVIYNY